jgi:hypothetical protein
MLDRCIRWKPVEIQPHDFRSRLKSDGTLMLPQRVLDAVFFLYQPDDSGAFLGPCGTGIFIAVKSDKYENLLHYYAVTNHHIVHGSGASAIRLNTNDGGHRFIKLEPHDWHRMKHDDIAAVDITDKISGDDDDIVFFPSDWLLTSEFISEYQVGIGDDVVMLGLLARSEGKKRNQPVARFGSIARIATEQNKVRHDEGYYCEAHICDMRSRTGFSGSPVFVYRVFNKNLDFILKTQDIQNHEAVFRTFFKVLGIHFGQFNEPARAKIAEARPLQDGDRLDLPSGLTMVSPSWRVLEMLNHNALAAQRDARDALDSRQKLSDSVATLEPVVWTESEAPKVEAVERGSDANPTHREDFTRLATAAAKKKQPAE